MRQIAGFALSFAIGVVATAWWMSTKPTGDPGTAKPGAQTLNTPQATRIPGQIPQTQVAQSQAPSTLTGIAQLTGDFEQTLALYRLMENKDTVALLELLQNAKSELGVPDYADASAILYARLAELDPEAAVQHILNNPGMSQSRWLHSAFHAWARIDLDAAKAAAANLSRPHKHIAGQAILRSRGDLSPTDRDFLAEEFGNTPAPADDFHQAWAQATSANPRQRAQRLAQVAQTWAQSDPQAAYTAVGDIKNRMLRDALKRQVLHSWLEQDPATALQIVLEAKASRNSISLIQTAFQKYASDDPIAAQVLAESLSGAQRNHAIVGLLQGLAATDTSAAIGWIETLETPELRHKAVSSLAKGIVHRPTDVIDQWIDSLGPEEKQIANKMISTMGSYTDPERFAQWVESMPATDRASAARRLVDGWAQQDIEAAAAWVETLPNSERIPLNQHLARKWASWDFEAAEQFANQLPTATERDEARMGLVRNISDTTAARRIVDSISDPTLRKQAATRAYNRLRGRDPAGGSEFARDMGISE